MKKQLVVSEPIKLDRYPEGRLHEIMRIARALSWFQPNPRGYPLMQGSEVEKCILMALDDDEFDRFQRDANNPVVVNAIKNDPAVRRTMKPRTEL
jgi:hypothetical protein